MKVTEYSSVLREILSRERSLGKKIVLVPTMGFLHAGHLSMPEAIRRKDKKGQHYFIVMSLFINPLQFGPEEDYATYPRNLDRDTALAEKAGVDILFAPAVEEMYPAGDSLTNVQVGGVSEGLCGGRRPGHFQGVATVVTKLFNIVQPDVACFGQKDYQQFMVIRQLVQDLCYPIRLLMAPIVRESDGLAMSSRNAYLSVKERAQAPALYAALQEGARLIESGECRADVVGARIRQTIKRATQAVIDYVEIRGAEDLAPVISLGDDVVLLVAAMLGSTRLIDNLIVSVPRKEVTSDD